MSITERVLARLGFSSPPPTDNAGLSALYAAWCISVPFDNIGKLIALRTSPGDPLPGMDATEFFERWLTHGVGATCWATANALHELLVGVGFDAHRVAGSMRDTGYIGHGSVRVCIDGIDWLADSSLLTDIPLPLTSEIFVASREIFGAESEPSADSHIVWADNPPNATLIPCRISIYEASHEFYVERYEASRQRSPFNDRLYARQNRIGERLVLDGNTRILKTALGTEIRDLARDELFSSLIDEFGISGEFVDKWRMSGAIDASFLPASTPPAPNAMLPPSMRGTLKTTQEKR
ncbi:MAG: arylamine N-acetyltransferase [Gemmatimonadales bacterium]